MSHPKGAAPREPVVPALSLEAARTFGHTIDFPPNPFEKYCTFLATFAALGVFLGEPLITWAILLILVSIWMNGPQKHSRVSPLTIGMASCLGFLAFEYYRMRHGLVGFRGFAAAA
jgi:hypothetical protein